MAGPKGFGLGKEIDGSWLLTDGCDTKGGLGGGCIDPPVASLKGGSAGLDAKLRLKVEERIKAPKTGRNGVLWRTNVVGPQGLVLASPAGFFFVSPIFPTWVELLLPRASIVQEDQPGRIQPWRHLDDFGKQHSPMC